MLTPRHGDNRTLALLGSLCLFLSAIEYLIPKPLPFMRIGLANLPLLLALNMFGTKDFFVLALLKVLGQGIIGGTLFSYVFVFSAAGTGASAAVMWLLHRLWGNRGLGFAGLGCAGAMASNGMQLLLARYWLFGPAFRYLVPPFLASGFMSGIALGLLCAYFCRHSRWYAGCTAETIPQETTLQAVPTQSRWDMTFRSGDLLWAGLCMALVFLFCRSLPGRTAQFFFFCLLAGLSGKKINLSATMLFMAGIVFFNLLAPYGKVLAVLGPLRLTEGSLIAGLEKAVTLGGLLMLSRACVSGNVVSRNVVSRNGIKSGLRLVGLGSLLGDSLRMLELLRERKGLIGRGHILGGIDRLLQETEAIYAGERVMPQEKLRRSGKSMAFLCGMVILTAVMGFGIMAYGQR
jgi:heptaprenyl diphosphate synthase